MYPEKGIILYVYATKDNKVNGDCNTVGLIITDEFNLKFCVISILDEGNEVNYLPWPEGKQELNLRMNIRQIFCPLIT